MGPRWRLRRRARVHRPCLVDEHRRALGTCQGFLRVFSRARFSFHRPTPTAAECHNGGTSLATRRTRHTHHKPRRQCERVSLTICLSFLFTPNVLTGTSPWTPPPCPVLPDLPCPLPGPHLLSPVSCVVYRQFVRLLLYGYTSHLIRLVPSLRSVP